MRAPCLPVTSPAQRSLRRTLPLAALGALVLAAPAAATTVPDGADAAAFPVTIVNCDIEATYEAAPSAAVTMNQAATEIMLALGLADSMVGTAYLDDEILPELADAYAAIPVLSEGYPSSEVLLAAEPDFVYGSYRSAFGPDAAGDRDGLAGAGIGSYNSPAACPDRPADFVLTTDVMFQEIADIGTIFGVSDRAEALIAEQQALLDGAQFDGAADVTVAWWDGGLDAPSVGACCGAPGLLMRALGVANVFEELPGGWADASWEAFVDADPDVIIIIDAEWSTADDKIAHLRNDPALSAMAAVEGERFVIVPFSATTPGVRVVPAIAQLSTDISALLTPA